MFSESVNDIKFLFKPIFFIIYFLKISATSSLF